MIPLIVFKWYIVFNYKIIFYVTDEIKLYLYCKDHLLWLAVNCFEVISIFA